MWTVYLIIYEGKAIYLPVTKPEFLPLTHRLEGVLLCCLYFLEKARS